MRAFFVLFLCITTVFLIKPEIDIWFSALFFDATTGRFNHAYHPIARFFYHLTDWLVFSILAIMICVLILHYIKFRSLLTRLVSRNSALYLVLALMFGPGLLVHQGIKPVFDRPRPDQTIVFNGTQDFIPPLYRGQQEGKSFVSGHASAAFFLTTLAVLFGKRLRPYVFAGTILFASIVGLTRIIEGRHFLSDVVFAGFFTLLMNALLYKIIMKEWWHSWPQLARNIYAQLHDVKERQGFAYLIAGTAAALVPLFIINARVLAEICVAITGICFLYHHWRTRDWQWLKQPLIRIMCILWLGLCFIITPLAAVPSESFPGAAGWIRFVLFFIALSYWLPREQRFFMTLIKANILLIALVVLDTLIQATIGMSLTGNPAEPERLTGPLDRTNVGIYLTKLSIPIIGIGLWYYIKHHRYPMAYSLGALLLAVFLCVLFSGERGALILLGLSSAAMGSLLFITLPASKRMVLISAFTGVAICASTYILDSRVQSRVNLLVEHTSHYQSSPYGQLMEAGLQIWRSSPISGVGIKNFRIVCPEIVSDDLLQRCDNLHPHNYYMEWLSQTGVIGFAGFIILAICLFALPLLALRHIHSIDGILAIIAFGTVVINYFPFMATQSYFSNWPALIMWCSMAYGFAGISLLRNQNEDNKTN